MNKKISIRKVSSGLVSFRTSWHESQIKKTKDLAHREIKGDMGNLNTWSIFRLSVRNIDSLDANVSEETSFIGIFN